MTLLDSLGSDNPRERAQGIKTLVNSSSPYAMELLKQIYQKESDNRVKTYAQEAAGQLRKNLVAEYMGKNILGKLQDKVKGEVLQEHQEILLALAAIGFDSMQPQASRQHIIRAYALDTNMLENNAYLELAADAFNSTPHAIEEELEEEIRTKNRLKRALNSKTGCIGYLIDVPMALILGAVLVGPPMYFTASSYTSRASFNLGQFMMETIENTIGFEMMWIIIAVLLVFVIIRLGFIFYEQWEKKNQPNWQKEARINALADSAEEMDKLFNPQKYKSPQRKAKPEKKRI